MMVYARSFRLTSKPSPLPPPQRNHLSSPQLLSLALSLSRHTVGQLYSLEYASVQKAQSNRGGIVLTHCSDCSVAPLRASSDTAAVVAAASASCSTVATCSPSGFSSTAVVVAVSACVAASVAPASAAATVASALVVVVVAAAAAAAAAVGEGGVSAACSLSVAWASAGGDGEALGLPLRSGSAASASSPAPPGDGAASSSRGEAIGDVAGDVGVDAEWRFSLCHSWPTYMKADLRRDILIAFLSSTFSAAAGGALVLDASPAVPASLLTAPGVVTVAAVPSVLPLTELAFSAAASTDRDALLERLPLVRPCLELDDVASAVAAVTALTAGSAAPAPAAAATREPLCFLSLPSSRCKNDTFSG